MTRGSTLKCKRMQKHFNEMQNDYVDEKFNEEKY